ncbi:MAG TPA: universal stress protein [Chryseosolibacter sp.]
MKKVLVTTDLSVSSKAGIRFAIQLAKQAGSTLIFYHGTEINKPTRWTDEKFNDYVQEERGKAREKVDQFVRAIYKDSGIRPGSFEIVIERVISFTDSIVNFAAANNIDFICMSTRGAGKLKRLVGSNTSAIIKTSPVPVFAIPVSYRQTAIKEILYASDLNALSSELATVKDFAAQVKAKVTVLHYDYLYQLEEVRAKFDKLTKQEKTPGVRFHLEQFNIENSLSLHLKNAVRKFDPSLVVLFTNQDRDWFERLFLSSKSAEISFGTKKPLLIFGKGHKRA